MDHLPIRLARPAVSSFPQTCSHNSDAQNVGAAATTAVAALSKVCLNPVIISPTPQLSCSSPAVCAKPTSHVYYQYFVFDLYKGLHPAWGMSLSFMDNLFLIVSDVNQLVARNITGRCWGGGSSTMHPNWIWRGQQQEKQAIMTAATNAFVRFIQQQPAQMQQRTIIMPGDCIMAIDGRSVVEFSTLLQITTYLRRTKHVQLLMLRNPSASIAMMSSRLTNNSLDLDFHEKLCRVAALYKQIYQQQHATVQSRCSTAQKVLTSKTKIKKKEPGPACLFRNCNPLFQEDGKDLQYEDDYEFEPDEGYRADLFLRRVNAASFKPWLEKRKRKWRRENYNVYTIEEEWVQEDEFLPENREDSFVVPVDFWSDQGFTHFSDWLVTRIAKWTQNYSWNRAKRQRLERDCEEVVSLETGTFDEWLRVRKNQWRIARRKRQRERDPPRWNNNLPCPENESNPSRSTSAGSKLSTVQSDMILIDALLEAQEEERKRHDSRPPLDISFLFDSSFGCPDDVVLHCLRFLRPLEYSKLLCISRTTRKTLADRCELWRQLCPPHWNLPRRPRKPWHEIYLHNLRVETERSRKKWDDLLSRVSEILLRGDPVTTIEKLVTESEQECGFDVDYVSSVVCERNSILNLAVIQQRHKVVRWLVEVKGADIETFDRGQFTPLLNAAWAGDKYLVRFFMQKGADRSKVGRFHYSKGLCAPDFKGMTADEWATRRGHHNIATLIKLGL